MPALLAEVLAGAPVRPAAAPPAEGEVAAEARVDRHLERRPHPHRLRDADLEREIEVPQLFRAV